MITQDKISKKFLEAGVFAVSAKKNDSEIRELLESLKPIATEYDLIRIGNQYGDGGYLLPDCLDGIEFCFSPGVSDEYSFDKDLSQRGIECFLADYSVDGLKENSDKLNFEKKFIGSYNSDIYININDWIRKHISTFNGDGILQMDIEGQEYETIYALDQDLLDRFRVIVIEFHHLHYLFDKCFHDVIANAFRKLIMNFSIVHIHPNNTGGVLAKNNIEIPRAMEFTFLHNSVVNATDESLRYPHKLDKKCAKGTKDIILPACWHEKK